MYCFEDNVCFLLQDFEVMKYFTSTHRTSVFTYRVMCSKYILADQEDLAIIGEIFLHENTVTRRSGDRIETLATFRTEQDRIEALYKFLGVTLSPSQAAGI
ncbi:hypothetical protein B0A55_13012 [Friedmanniomyces simplex]|uniref:Uncharacterized protein n=1 Tax=Friedmanniomyces simplex TaxID=329884 RepID=A0A4U0W5H9_9PEZI|nr:hypothetical protein B0A55_13012 [Friedmanniomyces simplex]